MAWPVAGAHDDRMDGSHFENIHEYNAVDLARRHRSTAGTQEAVDDGLVDRLMESVDRDGYVVVEGLVDASTLEAIKEDVRARFVYEGGRNNFEGFRTQRLYRVLEKTFVCNALVEHPLVLALLDRVLMPNYLLSQLQVIDILGGEAQQPLHFDDAFYPFARPRPALGAATIFAIDDFTEHNGATVVVPGSHRWGDRLPAEADTAIPAVMPAGSMLFFLGTTWHGGGANHTDAPRLCVTAQYCQPYLRTQENYSLGLSRARAAQLGEHMQRMLGYSIHPPFVGMVDGKHPKRLLEELDG